MIRLFAGALAVAVWATLITRFFVTADTHDVSLVEAAWRSFRFFTIWTNALIGVVCGLIALGGRPGDWMTAGLALSIAFVAAVYHALLAQNLEFFGIEWVIDVMLHTVVPAVFVALWFVALPKGALRKGHVLYWMAFPIIYCVYALVRAAFDGTYPYFFLNLETLGVGGVALWVFGLAAVFVVGGTGVMGLARVAPKGA